MSDDSNCELDTNNSDLSDYTSNLEDLTDDLNDDSTDDVTTKKISEKKKKTKKNMMNKKMDLKDAIKTVDERSLYIKIHRFFKTQCTREQINKMINIINHDDTISLRLLNWFAMKHSATMRALEVENNNGIELFDVKISYKARLSTHSKKYFDPFRRGKRFDYYYNPDDNSECIETTLCQLNFFRWLFLHNLMDYVEDNFDDLKQKMGVYEKKKKYTKKTKNKTKNTIVKNKKEDTKLKIKRFTEEDISKLVIIM